LWCQRGQYHYLPVLINAPIALKVTHYKVEVSATYTAYKGLVTNMWIGLPDQQIKRFGALHKVYDITMSANKQAVAYGYHANIKCIGEILHFVSCGIHKVSPPLDLYLYAAKTKFENIFYVKFDLVDIKSKCLIVDSAIALTETFEYFDAFSCFWKKYTVFDGDDFNTWVGFRRRIITSFNEEYNNFLKHTYLHFKKTINDMNQEPIHTHAYVERVNTEFSALQRKYTSKTDNNMNSEIIPSYYATSDGKDMIDIVIEEVLVERDWYYCSRVVIGDSITIIDKYIPSFIVLYDSLIIRDMGNYEIN
jgi:hypothetical protein